MYLTPTDKHWVLDVEANGLKPTKLWVCSFKNAITKQKETFTDYVRIRDFIGDAQRDGGVFVGHNIIGYDAPVLNRLVGTRLTVSRLVDTFLMSSVYSPSLAGGHSLDAWAGRLGKVKPQHDDWDNFSPEMLHRNQEDVEIGEDLYVKLAKRMTQVGFKDKCLEIEHKAWHIIQNKQKKNGFHFNQGEAVALYAELRGVEEEIKKEIYHVFPPKLCAVAQYARAFKKDGSETETYRRHAEQYEKLELLESGGYKAYDFVEFNLGSPKQRVDKLLELGWVPEEFTPKGTPKPTAKGDIVPSLAKFCDEGGPKEIRSIADWIAINARANAVSNWLDLYNEETGAIHGNLWLANSLRYRHDNPNTANIPAVRSDKRTGNAKLRRDGFYTYEARDLWTTRDANTRNLVGVDAVAIQFRILAAALGDEEFKNVVLSGDIHTYNQEKTGHGTREQNKTFGYAALLGAGAAKVGQIFGVSAVAGGKIKKNWIKTVPGLRELYDRLENELATTGRITLCDGGRVIVPSPHMVLAYLLQGDESRIMKQSLIYTDELCRKEGIDSDKVGDIHDEWQNDVAIKDTERYEEVCTVAFNNARDTFDYGIRLDCSSKVGKTWAETH